MHKFSVWVNSVLSKGGAALMVFPAAVAFGLFAAIVSILDVGASGATPFLTALMAAFITGLISNILIVLIARRAKLGVIWTLALTGAGILLPCLAFLLLYTTDLTSTNLIYIRIMAANIVMAIMVFVVLLHKNERFTASGLTMWLLREAIGGAFLGLVFFLITAGITGIINILFLRSMSGMIYRQLLYVSLFIVFVFFIGAFGDAFDSNRPPRGDGPFERIMEKITGFIIIPVIVVLFIAVIAWLCKGIWWNNWPSAIDIFSRVSLLLLGACFAFVLSISFDNLQSRLYRVFLPTVGIPLLGVGVWRLIALMLDYGITEKRYFALIGYIFLAVCLFGMLFTPRGHGMMILVTAMVLVIITVMPAFNYHTVSAYSQVKRAEWIMKSNGMLEGSAITPPKLMDDEDRLELSRSVQYIVEVDETAMAPWLPLNFDFFEDYQSVFGVQGEYNEQGESIMTPKVLVGELADKYYKIDGYDILLTNFKTYSLLNFSLDNIAGRNGTYSVIFTDDAAADSVIAIVKMNGEVIAEKDITDRLAAISAYLKTQTKAYGEVVGLPLSVMTIDIRTEWVDIRVILKGVTATVDEANKTLTTVLTDVILIREK